MHHRITLAALALSAASIVPLAVHAAPDVTTTAAPAECLSGPKGGTPAGKHWYYRLDRATKKQCWYLGDQRAPAAPKMAAKKPAAVEVADDEANIDAPLPAPSRPVADARAEYLPTAAAAQPQSAAPASAAQPAPVPQAQPQASSPWDAAPRTIDAAAPPASSSASTPAPSPVVASTAPAPAAVTAPAAAPPAAPPSSASSGISFWMLAVGLVAALGVAGFIARLLIGFNASAARAPRAAPSRGLADVELPPIRPADRREDAPATAHAGLQVRREQTGPASSAPRHPNAAALARLAATDARPRLAPAEDYPPALPRARDLDAEAAAALDRDSASLAPEAAPQAPPSWMRAARDRSREVEAASAAIEELLAMAPRRAVG